MLRMSNRKMISEKPSNSNVVKRVVTQLTIAAVQEKEVSPKKFGDPKAIPNMKPPIAPKTA